MDTVCATLAFIDGLGAPEMVLIFVIVLVLFGGQKLPEFARGLGKSIREFKKAAAGVEEEFKRALEEDERKNTAPKLTAATTPEPVDTSHDYTGEYDHTADPAGPEAPSESPVTASEITPAAPATSEVASAAPATAPLDKTPPAGIAPASEIPAPPANPPAPPASATPAGSQSPAGSIPPSASPSVPPAPPATPPPNLPPPTGGATPAP